MPDDLSIPFSNYASPVAARFYAALSGSEIPALDSGVELLRTHYRAIDRRRADAMAQRFDVVTEAGVIGGVPVQVVTPRDGVAASNASRVLVNLHGGAFLWGGEYGGLVESIPIAATGRVKVVAVDYRLGPEHVFPAASEDVAAVYTELLDDYDAKSIGIYGCSAGGVLAAQSIIWLVRSGLPLPGAVGTFCGTGLEFGGDSTHLAPIAVESDQSQPTLLRLHSLPYFQGTSHRDPVVFPFVSDDGVRCFPPTLMIAGGRDFAASSLTVAHRRLSAAGCESRLYLFDGMWHAFFADPELPESQEAYDLICAFFMECLGGT